MKGSVVIRSIFVVLVCLILLSSVYSADTKSAPSSTSDDTKSFYLALSEYFKIPLAEVMSAHDQRIPDDELAVPIFIALKAGIRPAAVIEIRKLGKSWSELADHFGVSPDQFYVSVTIDAGPPYGKALGHFKKHPKSEWKKIQLDNEDIINLVNLRFISGYHRVSTDDVVKLRCQGKPFVSIFKDVRPQPQDDKGKADRAAKREEMKKKALAGKK